MTNAYSEISVNKRFICIFVIALVIHSIILKPDHVENMKNQG